MASKYTEAPLEVHQTLKEIIEEHYKEINAVGVTFDIILAFGARNEVDELVGPAIKVHGVQANGMAKIVDLKNRVMGRRDGEILLDGDVWDDLKAGQQKALLDHELYHFDIARNIKGEVIRDTAGRPKLKMRQHDREFGWFDIIAARYGEDSGEVQQARQLFDECAQVYFSFLGDKTLKGRRPLKLLPKPKEKKSKAKGDKAPPATAGEQQEGQES